MQLLPREQGRKTEPNARFSKTTLLISTIWRESTECTCAFLFILGDIKNKSLPLIIATRQLCFTRHVHQQQILQKSPELSINLQKHHFILVLLSYSIAQKSIVIHANLFICLCYFSIRFRKRLCKLNKGANTSKMCWNQFARCSFPICRPVLEDSCGRLSRLLASGTVYLLGLHQHHALLSFEHLNQLFKNWSLSTSNIWIYVRLSILSIIWLTFDGWLVMVIRCKCKCLFLQIGPG